MKRGFTLIEVLVTMAIVSILAGMMIPAVWKMWESQEVQTTKERLNALKLAMVGDRSLIQNGIRTSYGFVGDNGELPFGNISARGGLKYLISNPAPEYPAWNGPYLSGFDPATYIVDAWGKPFRYTLVNNLDGYGNRYLSGEIRSAGPNGFLDNADDIFVVLSDKEVAPTHRIQGNFSFANLTGKSANFEVRFSDPESSVGERTLASVCKTKTTFPNFSTIFPNAAAPVKLPIGKISITGNLYNDSNCTTPAGKSQYDYFVSDNISSLYINLPAFVPIP